MSDRSTFARVPIVAGAAALLARYDVVISDVWGVLHNGLDAYPAAGEALARFRQQGGKVILLSNAPIPVETVTLLLAERRVRRDAWDRLVTSGDITRVHLAERGYRRVHHVGPARDLPVFATTAVERVGLEAAEAVVVTGLVDDVHETGEHYRPLLEAAYARGLPLICANPDLVVEVGSRMCPCAGAVAILYERMGGDVFWAGKPYPVAYEMALAAAAAELGRMPERSRVLAIGDAVRTDLAGAARSRIDALFIGQGIHRHELGLADGHGLVATSLDELLASAERQPIAAMRVLAW